MEHSITRYGRAAFSRAQGSCVAAVGERRTLGVIGAVDDGSPIVTLAPVTPVPVVTPAPVTTPAPIATPALIVTPAPVEIPLPDDGIDCSDWSKGLVEAHTYLAEKQWGPRWTQLLNALAHHKWSYYHPEEEDKLPKMRSRPQEFADWMKEHRQLKDYAIGDDFGAELLEWWKELGPAARWETSSVGKGDKEPRWEHECRGGDGIGANEVALEGNKVWQLLVSDITWVLENILPQQRKAMDEWAAEKAAEKEQEEEEEEEEDAQVKREKAAEAPVAKGKARAKGKKGKDRKKKPAEVTGKNAKRKRTAGEEEGDVEEQSVTVRPKPKPLTRSAHALRIDEIQARENGDLPAPATSSAATPAPPSTDNPEDTSVSAPNKSPPGTENSGLSGSAGIFREATPSPNQENSTNPPAPSTAGRPFVLSGSVAPAPGLALTHADFSLSPTALAPNGAAVDSGIDVRPSHHGRRPLSTENQEMEVDLDPFANSSGLTVEELEEITMDQDADESEEENDSRYLFHCARTFGIHVSNLYVAKIIRAKCMQRSHDLWQVTGQILSEVTPRVNRVKERKKRSGGHDGSSIVGQMNVANDLSNTKGTKQGRRARKKRKAPVAVHADLCKKLSICQGADAILMRVIISGGASAKPSGLFTGLSATYGRRRAEHFTEELQHRNTG
ncbi:hypothetical protein K438DRAFT_1760078 [Mycena galopus ATCC 62051]|nr:hypothetical protein K438DRAFT_1760078 [Mycena galopus ATCC 62051]